MRTTSEYALRTKKMDACRCNSCTALSYYSLAFFCIVFACNQPSSERVLGSCELKPSIPSGEQSKLPAMALNTLSEYGRASATAESHRHSSAWTRIATSAFDYRAGFSRLRKAASSAASIWNAVQSRTHSPEIQVEDSYSSAISSEDARPVDDEFKERVCYPTMIKTLWRMNYATCETEGLARSPAATLDLDPVSTISKSYLLAIGCLISGPYTGDTSINLRSNDNTTTSIPHSRSTKADSNWSHRLNLGMCFSQSSSYDWLSGERTVVDVKANVRQTSQLRTSGVELQAVVQAILGANTDLSQSAESHKALATDNEFSAELRCIVPLGWMINPFVSGSVKSPIAHSYASTKQPLTSIASLWDPVTSDQCCGFHYNLQSTAGMFMLHAGANLQQIRAQKHRQRTDDPRSLESKEGYKASASIDCALNANLTLDSNLSYSAAYQSRKNILRSDSWQLRLDNELRIKIWRYFGLSIIANFSYDDTQSRRVQFKQSTMFGLLFDS